MTELITLDRLFEADDARQVAYAQAWLLVHELMQSASRLPQFRSYLAALRNRRDAAHRLDDARAAFGDLAQLDAEVRSTRRGSRLRDAAEPSS